MIVTNLLTKVNFSSLPETLPTAWDLTSYIPNGALDVSQVLARSHTVADGWTTFESVTAFSNATNIATYTAPTGTDQVEFMRSTPRYAAYLDPEAPTSRVSQRNLQVNADQGLYVAVEWAAQYGIDAMQPLLPSPGLTPNQLGLQQQTQNYWVAADYTKTTWNFQFAGGYIDPSHVKVQVLLTTGWTALTVDLVNPSAPFRFIGEYQLYLDFSVLSEVPQALIIYRHTPRDIHVSSPLDRARITADGMSPSARHALFVAVEIGEMLSMYVPVCECTVTYAQALEADDPLVWWKMDELTGTVGSDSGRLGLPFTLNPANLTFGGDGLWSAGHSLVCGGSAYNGGIAAHNDALNFQGDGFTITSLVNWTGSSSDSTIVGHGQTNTDWANWNLFITPAGNVAVYISSANDLSSRVQFTTSAVLTPGQTYRLVYRWIKSTGEIGIWIDGDKVLTDTWAHTLWLSTAPVGVSTLSWASGSDLLNSPFQGRIDEIAIYDTPLTDDRIAAHWAAFLGNTPPVVSSFCLREDGGFELREDGGFALRE
jgi:concanavalin A-like lectin/glucanase superfamily protein